jgi:hypothetical protein
MLSSVSLVVIVLMAAVRTDVAAIPACKVVGIGEKAVPD